MSQFLSRNKLPYIADRVCAVVFRFIVIGVALGVVVILVIIVCCVRKYVWLSGRLFSRPPLLILPPTHSCRKWLICCCISCCSRNNKSRSKEWLQRYKTLMRESENNRTKVGDCACILRSVSLGPASLGVAQVWLVFVFVVSDRTQGGQ